MSRYKPYPEYKESGVEWLGEVPEQWEVMKLKYIAHSQPSNIDKKSKDGEPDVLLCNYTDVYYNDFITNEIDFMKATATYDQINKFRLDVGDVIITKDSEGSEDIAIAAYVKETQDNLVCGYHLTLIKPTECVGSYLFRAINSTGLHDQFKVAANGITRYGLSVYGINNVLLPVPSSKEQTTIANFLERETTKIDILISKQERLIELLQEKIISVAMDEQINGEGKFERLMHLVDIIERPVKLNPQTEYTALGLYNRGRGLFHKPAKHGNEMGDSDFFYVKSGDLILSGQFAWEGAVALAKDTENGCVVSHRYPILRGKTLHTEYLLALFMTDFGNFLLNECSRGAAGRNRPLNTGLLLSEKIRVPSESTQNIIKKLVYKKFEIEQKAKKAITLLKERRTALISAAVTGKIDVREAV